MNHEQTAKLVRLIGACCPAQNLDEYTSDIWQPILADITLEDAQQALIELARTAAFISPADIIAKVQKTANDRIQRVGDLTPPAGLSQPYERMWLKDVRRQIAQGIPPHIAIQQTNHDIGIQDGIHDRELSTN